MYAFASSVAATRRVAALVVLAALAVLTTLALLVSGAHHAGSSTASPRWNTAAHVVADKAVFAKPQSPRWN